MTCREFADFIVDYLAGELPADAREPFERHLSRCHNCHEYLAQYMSTIEAGRLAFRDLDEDVPADVPEDLVKAVLAARKRFSEFSRFSGSRVRRFTGVLEFPVVSNRRTQELRARNL